MVKIISLIIHFLNIIKKLLYKSECFLLKFLPSDPNPSSSGEAYRRFKVHPLPVIQPEHLPIPFDEAKAAYAAKHNKPLKPVFRHEGKVYPPKGTVCPHCGATHEYLSSITATREHRSDARSVKRLSPLKRHILSRLSENALTAVRSCRSSNQEITLTYTNAQILNALTIRKH